MKSLDSLIAENNKIIRRQKELSFVSFLSSLIDKADNLADFGTVYGKEKVCEYNARKIIINDLLAVIRN